MIKTGDKVEVNGATASVEAVWAQGRHTNYKLSDGRTVLDLEALVQAGQAKLIVVQPPRRLTFDPRKLVADEE